MALETLKDVKEIGGFNVVNMGKLKEEHPEMFNEDQSMNYKMFEEKIRPSNFIYVRDDVNSLAFTIQNGPIKENGVNGCQVDTIIETALKLLEGLESKFPCDFNRIAMDKLWDALQALEMQREDRENRGVEGYDKQ